MMAVQIEKTTMKRTAHENCHLWASGAGPFVLLWDQTAYMESLFNL